MPRGASTHGSHSFSVENQYSWEGVVQESPAVGGRQVHVGSRCRSARPRLRQKDAFIGRPAACRCRPLPPVVEPAGMAGSSERQWKYRQAWRAQAGTSPPSPGNQRRPVRT